MTDHRLQSGKTCLCSNRPVYGKIWCVFMSILATHLVRNFNGELEFMHFLCFQEHNSTEDRLSYQLAQLDFSTRHLVNWVPDFQKTLKRISIDAMYTKIVVELNKFLEDDIEWQLETINDP